MNEHPLFRMWKERLDAELAREKQRTARRVAREAERAGWYEAWALYKRRHTEIRTPLVLPRWWNLLGWLRWLLRLHAPGRPN
jgi:hypothetical protein